MAESREQNHSARLAVLEEQVKALRAEIADKAVEYQRRLLELNHAHEKQVKDQSTYVSDDKFSGYVSKVDARLEKVDARLEQITKTLSELEGRSGGKNSVQELILKILPLLIAALTLAAFFWRR